MPREPFPSCKRVFALCTQATDSEDLSLLWNNVLSTVAVGNAVAAVYLFVLRPAGNSLGRRGDAVPGKTLYNFANDDGRQAPPGAGTPALLLQAWHLRPVLAGLYVLGCGVRSIWPRFDGECLRLVPDVGNLP
jgi:hypothetical protein